MLPAPSLAAYDPLLARCFQNVHVSPAVALAAARREVVAARAEPGVDPEVADRVLRRLDVRSLARAVP